MLVLDSYSDYWKCLIYEMSHSRNYSDKKPEFSRDHLLDLVDSDMLERENEDGGFENHTDEFIDEIEELEDEDDSLQRLSDQAMRRREYDPYDDGDEEEEEEDAEAEEGDEENDVVHGDEDEEEDDLDPVDFLRRLIQTRSQGGRMGALEDENDDEDDDESNSHSDPLRAMRLIGGDRRNTNSYNDRTEDNDERTAAGNGFADVVHRIMRDGIMFSGFDRDNNEMQGLINNLNQRDDPYIILETLNELSERLLMMNGITAERMVPANKLAKSLINIMEDPNLTEELEINLVACRCLYNFLEVNQDFIHDALNNNAVECLCHKLLEITCIDLTEQLLQTLEMISRDPISHNMIIAANGLKACLQYLDFLTIHAQKKCLSIVANSCSNISLANFNMVKNIFDNISEVVRNNTDSNVVESSWLAISGIVMSFKLKPDYLEDLFLNNELLLRELIEIIYISSNKSLNSSTENEATKIPLNFGSCLSLIKSLIILSSVSVEISKTILETCSIGEIIVRSLNKYSKTKPNQKAQLNISSVSINEQNLETITSKSSIDNISVEALMAAPKELLSQFLNLIGYLLPISYDVRDSPFLKDNHEDYEEKIKINENRVVLCKEIIPDSYWAFVNQIWSLLINSFQATMDFEIRKKIVINLSRIISFSDGKGLKKIRGIEMISGLLASMINQSKSTMNKELPMNNNHQKLQFEKKNETDVDMLESDDEVDEISQMNSSRKSGSDDASKVNSNCLLLSAFSMSQALIEKSPGLFISDFEREGLFSDSLSILNNLKLLKYDSNDNLPNLTRTNLFSSNYTNKYIDMEFTRDFEYSQTSELIYSKLIKVAQNIEDIYFASRSSGGLSEVPDHMKELEGIRDTLGNEKLIKSFSFSQWKETWNRLKFSLSGSNGEFQISSFELISSGIIESLSFIFTSDIYDFGFEFSDCYKAFVAVFFVNNSGIKSKDSSILLLVNKLQEALTRCESFEIVSSGNTSSISNYNNESYHTSAMARQVKLKLTAEGDILENKLPTGLQNMVLSVHAIATFKSIDTFIKQRLHFLDELNGLGNEGDYKKEKGDDSEGNKEGDSNESSWTIEFLNDGEVIPNETTIYGAVYRSLQTKIDETVDSSKIWANIHNVSYRKVDVAPEPETKPIFYDSNVNVTDLDNYDKNTINILKLLKVLFEMNSFVKNNNPNMSSVSNDCFMNWKLTVKLNRQLEEPLVVASGTLPGWSINVTKRFPFIFPLDTRIFLLQSTSFGYSRLIHQWQIRTNQEIEDNNSINNQRPQLGRPTRHKVRLSRNLILQSAVKVLGLYGSSPGILEIEYFDEVGSGLGPTLEFYATVSKEFSKKKLRLWRDYDLANNNEDDYIFSKTGLFPAPLDKSQASSENGRKVLYFFSNLGKFIARALLDSRIIDFNFNPVFLKFVQFFNQNGIQKAARRDVKKLANMATLRLVDPELADSMEHLLKYSEQFSTVEEHDRDNIKIDDCTINDLSLSFIVPGYPKYELIPNGDDTPVTSSNLETYINKVLEATLYSGIVHQTKAFMDGFSKVFPITSLVIFSPEELVELFGSAEEDWSIETLPSAVNANHGYTKESESITRLINILVGFNDIEKRAFLQFLTGAPKLPIGGFKALRPVFTVVRKQADSGLKDDDYLPSVMTCANYLKLPNYSSESIMREKLLQAVNEGAGAFLLS